MVTVQDIIKKDHINIILEILKMTEYEIHEYGISIHNMKKVFTFFNIPVKLYNFQYQLIFKFEPIIIYKHGRNTKMFLALIKNNHVYPINKNLEKLSHLQDEKDVSLSASSNFYINDKTEPPKFKMSYRRTAENERKFVSWRPNLLCTNACRHEAHRLSWKNWKSLLAGLAETIAKPYDMCWHIMTCFGRIHAHHHNCPLGMHMSYVHTYCVYIYIHTVYMYKYTYNTEQYYTCV